MLSLLNQKPTLLLPIDAAGVIEPNASMAWARCMEKKVRP
jgi:hypothetical protein